MTEWTKKQYNAYYNAYMPWIEDKYLAWFGENKTSYTAKGLPPKLSFHISCPPRHVKSPTNPFPGPDIENLKSTKITGDKNVDKIQDGLAEGVGGQFSSGGLLGGVGDTTSKEGVNRAERGDTGPVDKEDLGKRTEAGKGWGESLSGGLLGGGKK